MAARAGWVRCWWRMRSGVSVAVGQPQLGTGMRALAAHDDPHALGPAGQLEQPGHFQHRGAGPGLAVGVVGDLRVRLRDRGEDVGDGVGQLPCMTGTNAVLPARPTRTLTHLYACRAAIPVLELFPQGSAPLRSIVGVRRLFWLVAAVVLVDTMFFAAVAPLLPHYEEELDLSKTAAGILTAAYPAGTFVGALPSGWLAIRWGVKKTLSLGS